MIPAVRASRDPSVAGAMDGRGSASAAIQRSTQYEELVRRQLNYSADSSISNSLSLPTYDETDTVSNDSEANVADDCSIASSGARKQDIREVQDYLERLDQKRGILERHASAELVRPSAVQADSLRRTGSASLPIPTKLSGSSQRLQKTQADEVASSARKEQHGADQAPPPAAATSHQQPVLRTPLTTPRVASVSGQPSVSGQQAREVSGGGGLTSSGTYEVLPGSSAAAAAAYRPTAAARPAVAGLGMTSQSTGAAGRGLEASYLGRDETTVMPQLSASERPASSPLTVTDLSGATGDGSAAAVAVLKMRLAAREDEVQRLSTQVHVLREGSRGQQNGGHAHPTPAEAGNADAGDRRIAAVLREKAELELRCDDLLREKENLTTELRKLQEQLDELRAASAAAPSKMAAQASCDPADAHAAKNGTLPPATVDERLLSYRPDNPNALQRKIDDLECQIQDLVEANETACDEVQRLESENQQLCEEIGSLKASHEMALMDLEAECKRLQEKLAQLQKKSMTADDLHLHSEVQQLQIDLRAQQEKNRVLNEENMGLRNALNESGRQRLSINDLTARTSVSHRATDGTTALPSFVDEIMAEDGDGGGAGGSSLAALHRLQRVAADVTAGGVDSRSSRPHTDSLPLKKPGSAAASAADVRTNGSAETRRRSDGTGSATGGGGGGGGGGISTAAQYGSAEGAKGKGESQRQLAAGAGPPAPSVAPLRASSPAGRSDLSDSTAVLLASYEPSFIRRPTKAGAGSAPLGYGGNGHCESKSELPAPVEVRPPGCRTALPVYIDEDGASDTTADILQDITTYLQGHKGDHEFSMKASIGRSDGRHRSYDSAVVGCHSEESSVSSSLSSLNEQPLEDEDFGAHQQGGVQSPRQNGGAGLRTVTSPLQVTQHNRHSFDGSSSTLSVTGRRPFAPRTPADLRLGDIIKYTRPDCRIARGVVKFIGHLHNKSDTFVGIETEYNDGKHDGIYDGSRYFQCKPNRGAFIPFTKVIMVWGS